MTFAEHFDELRTRLIVCAVSVVVFFIICYVFSDHLVEFLLKPYEAYRQDLIERGEPDPGPLMFIGLPEGFVFYLKTSFLAAIFLSVPVILVQMWKFIGAGLYKKERKSVMRVIPYSLALFLAGLVFGYLVLFPIGMRFLLSFPNPEILQASITVSKYFDIFFVLILVMGFMFQAPLVMYVTTSIGLTTPELFSSKRRYFLVGAFILAAFMTPPDAITQCLLAGPLVILFEVGILLSKRVKRISDQEEEAPVSEKAG